MAANDNHEIEIKFRIQDLATLTSRLRSAGFREITSRTHEKNTLYDLPGDPLRSRGALLRLRAYGDQWTLTYKDKPSTSGPHKSRREIETGVANGPALAALLAALGYYPRFSYEKFRSEWTDGSGHVVLDDTPIGNFGEIEGQPEWIDRTAHLLQIPTSEYITLSYTELFFRWKAETGSKLENMVFES
jgi:adenylate cyclase class 2